jgi:hypothetical protein
LKPFLSVVVFACLLGCVPVTPSVTAQDAEADKRLVLEYVARAKRLREFGYPLLARTQLDNAKKLDPNSRPMLIEYLRLFTRSEADARDTLPYVKSLLELFPDDYDACYEIASWLFLTQEPPLPPNVNNKDALQKALVRLDAEMVVYRELGKFVAKPEGALPVAAAGKPALPLAFLARCARASLTAEVSYLSARDLDLRAQDFDRWARTDPNLEEPFGMAAQELYELALPLYQASAKSDEYSVPASIMIAKALFHMKKYEDARKAMVAADLLSPGNVDIAELRLSMAEELRDFALLNQALTVLDEAYGDFASKLDLSVAKRVQDKGWSFELWLTYREILAMPPLERISAIRALLQERPDFLEIYYLDARQALTFAREMGTPEERTRFYEAVISALRHCEALGDTLADWHRVRASTLWETGKYADAAESYDRVAQLEASDVEARKYANAARDIAAGLYTAVDFEDYRAELEYGDLRTKREKLREIVTRSPKFFVAHLMLGKVAFMLADFETAYGAYAAGAKLKPDNVECLDGVAHSAMRTQRYEESLKHFKLLNEQQRDYQGAVRWEGILGWVVAGGDQRRHAFRLWLEASNAATGATERRKLLEETVLAEPDFGEALVDLAGVERTANARAAESYLTRALKAARDDDTRAAAHREYGRLRMSQHRFGEAVSQFEAAWGYIKGDGTDMLLVALAHHELGKEADASVAMRKLFAEVPNSVLLRPKPSDARQLDLWPVEGSEPRSLHPAYDVGDVMKFTVRTEVDGEGGGQVGRELSLEYDIRLEVLEKPMQNGIWRLKLSFENAPAEFNALHKVDAELKISPWFGLLEEPNTGALADVANPAVQAVAEGFTAGLGDAPVATPYLWKNDLTMGPPHFGGDAPEGSYLAEYLGDNFVIVRRSLAGRQVAQGEDHQNFSRGLEATVKCGGTKRALREVEFQILKKELTPTRDDVISSRLYVKLAAK